jgi:hypothetical protein
MCRSLTKDPDVRFLRCWCCCWAGHHSFALNNLFSAHSFRPTRQQMIGNSGDHSVDSNNRMNEAVIHVCLLGWALWLAGVVGCGCAFGLGGPGLPNELPSFRAKQAMTVNRQRASASVTYRKYQEEYMAFFCEKGKFIPLEKRSMSSRWPPAPTTHHQPPKPPTNQLPPTTCRNKRKSRENTQARKSNKLQPPPRLTPHPLYFRS